MPKLLSEVNGAVKVGIQSSGTTLDSASKINFENNRVTVSSAGIATITADPLTVIGL